MSDWLRGALIDCPQQPVPRQRQTRPSRTSLTGAAGATARTASAVREGRAYTTPPAAKARPSAAPTPNACMKLFIAVAPVLEKEHDRALMPKVHGRPLPVKRGFVTKGDLTRERIVEEAANQVSVRGLSGVSLGDVAAGVGLSKSGVFKHFQSKEALQQALVESVIAQFTERVWRPAEALARGEPRLRMMVDRWLDWIDGEVSRGGCGLTAFAIELDDQPGPLRDHLRWQQTLWQRMMTSEFARLREPRLDRDAADQAAFELKAIMLGYNHHRRLLDDVRARALVMRAFEALLERTRRV